jgi:hypothetical protein
METKEVSAVQGELKELPPAVTILEKIFKQ